MKLGGLLREAFDKAGVALPEKPRKKARHKSGKGKSRGDAKLAQQKKPQPQAENVRPTPKQAEVVKSSQPEKTVTVTANGTRITRWSAPSQHQNRCA